MIASIHLSIQNNELEKLKQLTSKLQAIELESAFKHDFGQFLGGDDCLVGVCVPSPPHHAHTHIVIY